MAIKTLTLAIKADTKDAKAGLGEIRQGIVDMMSGADGAGAKVTDGAAKALMGLSSALGTLSIHADILLGVAKTAVEMAQFAGEVERLSQRVSPVVLQGLRAATHGLVDDFTLLRVAAQGMQGDWALTGTELLSLGDAAYTAHTRGFKPAAQAFEEFVVALSTARVEKLRDYNIELKETSNRAELVAGAHRSLLEMFPLLTKEQQNFGDSTTRTMATAANAWRDFKVAVVDVGSGLAYAGAYLYEGTARIARWTSDLTGATWANEQLGRVMDEWADGPAKRAGAAFDALAHDAQVLAKRLGEAMRVAYEAEQQAAQQADDRIMDEILRRAVRSADRIKQEREKAAAAWARENERRRALESKEIEHEKQTIDEVAEARRKAAEKARDAELERIMTVQDAEDAQTRARRRSADAELQRAHYSDLGPRRWAELTRYADEYANAVEHASGAFQAFGVAGAAAFGQLISGQVGAGEAFADSVRMFLQSEAVKSAAMALESLAWAAFNFAMGWPERAAASLMAAEMFGGFAAAYGAGAYVAGPTSAQSASSAAGGREGGNAEGQSSAASSGGATVVNHYYLGYGFSDEKAFMRKIAEMQSRHALEGTVSASKPAARRAA